MSNLSRHQPLAVWLMVATTAAIALWWSARSVGDGFFLGDYSWQSQDAIASLLRGDLTNFFQALPTHPGGVVLESPGAILGARLAVDDTVGAFRGQALLGLLVLAIVAAAVAFRVAPTNGGRRTRISAVTLVALLVGSPLVGVGIQLGHPEEALTLGLVLSSICANWAQRYAASAALMGVAVAAKPWAAIAALGLIATAETWRGAIRTATIAGVAAVCVLAPVAVVAGPNVALSMDATESSGIFKPATAFWFLGRANPHFDPAAVSPATLEVVQRDREKPWAQRLERPWMSSISRPLVLLVALALVVVVRLRRGAAGLREDLLLLVAAALWWRCLLDTWNAVYYAMPPLALLAIWETRRGRPPWLAGAVTLATWVSFQRVPGMSMSPDAGTALYLAWSVPFALLLTVRAVAPERLAPFSTMLGRRVVVALPTLAGALPSSSRSPSVEPASSGESRG